MADGPARTSARFPCVGLGAGHYESFYLKACHHVDPIALWIRYTVHKRPHRRATGSLWFTLFDANAEGPCAVKSTLPEPGVGEGSYIDIGESTFSPGHVRGGATGAGRNASWELTFESHAEPLLHLPRAWMYRSALPRTKLLSPHPDARFSGRAEIDGRELVLDGWRGMVGHNWGSQHAERWIWLHAAGLGEEGSGWLDVGLGRLWAGPMVTPWIANGALFLGGERHRLGGVGRIRRTEVRERPRYCEFALPGRDMTVQGRVEGERKDFVGWIYADPDGGEHNTVNCSVADLTLTVSRPGRRTVTLWADGSAAYELGMRESGHDVEVQPFADG